MKYVWITAYVLSILLANITLDMFISLPIYGELSIGTLFFAFIFTLRDRIHEYGMNAVFWAIGAALFVTTVYSYIFGIEARFIFASFLSIAVGELADTLIFQSLKKRNWLVKCLSSNTVSVPLDSVLFSLLAFYGLPDFPISLILEIVFADIVAKYLIALCVAFPVYFTVKAPERARVAKVNS